MAYGAIFSKMRSLPRYCLFEPGHGRPADCLERLRRQAQNIAVVRRYCGRKH
jgi:hypothetical protein